mgnify:CR=1 FL=1
MSGVIYPDDSNEVVARIHADTKGELDNSNPWLPGGFLKAVDTGLARRVFDYYYQMKRLEANLWPDSDEPDYVKMWSDLKNILPLSASKARGPVVFTGTNSTDVLTGTVIAIGELEYTVDSTVTIESQALSVASLSASGLVAICITEEDHNMATGLSVTISGAIQGEWNQAWTPITVTGEKSFTFAVPFGISTPATGPIIATHISASADVTCSVATVDGNQIGGTELRMQSTEVGIDDTAVVQFGGLIGGSNDESVEDWQDRVIDRWRNPQTPFNPATIADTVRSIVGNTRVWVHRAYPAAGEVTVYFVRDNETSIIPTAEDESNTLAAVVAISPGNTAEEDIHVSGPIPALIDITVANIVPNTRTMRQAIESSIDSFFKSEVEEGQDFSVDRLKAAMYRSYDFVRGENIESFLLEAPVNDSQIERGYMAIKGTVSVAG